MPRMHSKIALIDPLTLVGKEVLRRLSQSEYGFELALFHTRADDEHLVADVAGGTGLVPPLSGPDDLAGCDAVVAATEVASDRVGHIARFLETHPEAPFVGTGGRDVLAGVGAPAACAPTQRPSPPHLRTAHPCLVSAHAVLRPLADLDPATLSIIALEPASAHGAGGIEELARQAAARLRGEPAQPGGGGQVTAFSIVADASWEFAEEAARLFPALPVSAATAAGGWFHGHAAAISVTFPSPVTGAEIMDRWEGSEQLAVGDELLRLDSVVDRHEVLIGPPRLSGDGRVLSVVAMADGLLIGGAATALELLLSLL